MNIREWVQQAGITATVVEDRGIVRDGDGWEHFAYVVQLETDDHDMSVPWMQGLGITENPANQAAEIVDSLISDVWGYQQAGSFEEWAGEYGYDTDSRKAEKIYNDIAALEAPFVALVGGQDRFEHVATEVDRL